MHKPIIYNVTIKVDAKIAETWLQWLLQVHVLDVMATKCFESFQVVRLLEVDDSEGPTYAVQYRAVSFENYQQYITLHANEMRKRSTDKWGDAFIAFRSVMEVIE